MAQAHRDGTLLSIGELAAASGLSPKALRMYADSELLPPRQVDPFSGYRSYGTDQVERARLIAALRGLGMGLARIRVLCDLDAAAAVAELRSWWHQEEADALSRGAAVHALALDLGGSPSEDSTMTTSTTSHAAGSRQIATAAHRGLVRAAQQDATLHRDLPGRAVLIAVADGFGGDDELSARMLSAFAPALERELDADPSADPLVALETAWVAAEALVPAEEPDGSTLTAALLHRGRLHVAHIGDTRVMLVHGDRIDPVTQDHTRLRSLVAAGRLSPEEVAAHPDRAVLNRALAAGAPTAPDLLVRRLEAGDLVLLASDGLHAVVGPSALAEALTDPTTDVDTLAEQLVTMALEEGAPDNVALALARV
ncbi:serine/threonine protein phosphatase [Brachybacterium sp. P6-10-X1]|uniref:MerR family transcriptional regulator n=1 Tax=Brachybacterium sp. P6-10-X1 TaxID=1903186 RepID=UPI000971A9A7|nr:MerR family transcriptional regulator [Brachybacterium sp. P6-10-X1]APX34118.1 serine/threonine protein phosphatase [Brachybacterium sp. P6-10-X1]